MTDLLVIGSPFRSRARAFSADCRPELSNWTTVRFAHVRARADEGPEDDPRNRLFALPAVRPARGRAPFAARRRAAAQGVARGRGDRDPDRDRVDLPRLVG